MKFKKTIAAAIAVCTLFCGCAKVKTDGEWSVYMPDGAPALALAALMYADKPNDGFDYRVVSSTVIASKVTANKEANNADFCVLPITAASKLLGNGERYTMVGTLTKGNLYLVSKQGGEITDLSALLGQTVGVVQIKEVPGLTLKSALDKNGVAWKELSQGERAEADKVNLQAVSGVDGSCAYYLLAEPAVSKIVINGFSVVGNLQTLYGENGYPQAVLVVKRSIAAQHAQAVDEFWDEVKAGVAWTMDASAQTLYQTVVDCFEDKGLSPAFTAQTLSKETVLRCGIAVEDAKLVKAEIEGYLGGLQGSFAMPSDKFYYGL